MAKARTSPAERHGGWEVVIGLETHVQLNTATKMFCRCENRFGAPPNSLTCPVCLGHPGSLPFANEKAVDSAILAGLAFGCDIAEYTKFDRKNYYYPDQPKNYQISQFDLPISSGGTVRVELEGEAPRDVRLTRIHLEEDAGKNIHVEGRSESQVDLNRTGTPLLEIVSEPDIHSPQEAAEYLRSIRLTMLYLGISDCNMEEGSLRGDCNVSIRKRGSDVLGTRTELKNLNSFTFVTKALEYEIQRQIDIVESGGEIIQETRLYDPDRDETRSMRGKEEAHDYRYFPEPDLPPLRIGAEQLEGLRARMPSLPWQVRARFIEGHGLPEGDARELTRDPAMARFYEAVVECYSGEAKTAANWVRNDLSREMNERGEGIEALSITPERLCELLVAVDGKKVSRQNGAKVLSRLLETDAPVAKVIDELGVGMVSDDGAIREAVQAAVDANPSVVDDLRQGKKNAKNFLVGQVMKATRGKANPGQVAAMISELTDG